MCDSVVHVADLIKLRHLKDWRVQYGLSISSFTVSIVVVILVWATHPSISGAAFKTFSTSVHLSRPRSPPDNGELLKSTHTGGQQIQETLFTGGVFHLQAGDLIQVCVSGRDTVNFESDSTYTGLIMLTLPLAATSTVKQ